MLFCAVGILILSPLLIAVALLLSITGQREVFYFQRRIGIKGKEFRVIKFATMLRESTELGGNLTHANDKRILKTGRFLRASKINELPQLFNILFGDMSLIGPRPQVLEHYEVYPHSARKELEKIRPGLSGLGSIVFREEESILQSIEIDPEAIYRDVIAPVKCELETWYVRNYSLGNYMLLLLLTVNAVLRPSSKLYMKCLLGLPIPVNWSLKDEIKLYSEGKV